MVIGILPATAGASDDNFEGNIFSLYAGNGSLVPPRVDLAQSLGRDRPSLLVFYLEDSRDCKQFVTTISQLQASYGKVASFIPINTDSLAAEPTDDPTDVRFYFNGRVPQTVLVAGDGEVTFDGVGQVRYEAIDNAFREVFDLLPREESVELKRRVLNEFNVELTR
ncbi:MAG: thylakoid membrane photosystem I accumulation factor [Cyanobacteria bacterium J06641_5]